MLTDEKLARLRVEAESGCVEGPGVACDMLALLDRNAQLEANLLDYWAAHGAVKHIEEPRVVRELKARVRELEADLRQRTGERDRLEQLVCDQREVLLTQKRDRDAARATVERVREVARRADGGELLTPGDVADALEAALTPPGDGGSHG